jgi:hypothetical protein
MKLDILTERGRQSARDADRAISLYVSATPGNVFHKTPYWRPADIDGIIASKICSKSLAGVVEIKCRYDLTVEQFRDQFQNDWLLTADKLVRAAAVAKSLGVPLFGFLFLVDCETLLIQQLAHATGEFACVFRCETTKTQKTINGGEAERANVFVSMDGCSQITKDGWVDHGTMAD